MDKVKRKRLEKKGWKVGSVDEFLLPKKEKLREKIYDVVYSGLDSHILYDRIITLLEDHGVYLDKKI